MTNTNNAVSTPDDGRAASGIEGLDALLGGGFPRHRLYLIEGDSGAGKTTLGLQFALAGARAGEQVLYMTLTETSQEIDEIARSHGWSLAGVDVHYLIEDKRLFEPPQTVLHPAEVDLPETTATLLEAVERSKPQRLVIDSLSELRLLAQDARWYRHQLLALKTYFASHRCTVLLLDNRSATSADLQVRSLANGVIELEQLMPTFGATRRRLTIVKMRGLTYNGGYHDFKIRTGGIEVYPRLVAAAHRRRYTPQRVSSGIQELDAMLGGGLEQGTSALLMGPAGAGKSLLATRYAVAAAQRGERVAFYAFDERLQTLFGRSKAMGLDLEAYISQGLMSVQQVDPTELSAGEFSHTVYRAVTEDQARLVVIDSLSGYLHAMPEERFLLLHMHELLNFLGQQGVTTLLVLIQQGLLGAQMKAPLEISYLADTVVLLRYFEFAGEMRQALSVFKHRSAAHERLIRELHLEPGHIHIGKPLTAFQGILTGLPHYAVNSPQFEDPLGDGS